MNLFWKPKYYSMKIYFHLVLHFLKVTMTNQVILLYFFLNMLTFMSSLCVTILFSKNRFGGTWWLHILWICSTCHLGSRTKSGYKKITGKISFFWFRLGYLKLYNLLTFSTIAYLVFALKFLYVRLAYQRGFFKSRDHRVYGL